MQPDVQNLVINFLWASRECQPLMALHRNMKGIFSNLGTFSRMPHIWSLKYKMHSHKFLVRQASIQYLFLPPKCMAESFTSISCIISGLQLASEKAKDLYNLMNFCIRTMFFAKESILFCITGGFLDSQLLPAKVKFTNYAQTSLFFYILLPVNRYNLCSLFVCFCFCCFTSHVNSYGHCGTVSSLNHTFSWAGLSKRLTSNLCTYFRL